MEILEFLSLIFGSSSNSNDNEKSMIQERNF